MYNTPVEEAFIEDCALKLGCAIKSISHSWAGDEPKLVIMYTAPGSDRKLACIVDDNEPSSSLNDAFARIATRLLGHCAI